MVINRLEDKNTVEFVSYTGKYPNLCRGVLTLKINGKLYTFGCGQKYDRFWESGGGLDKDYDPIIEEWLIDCDYLPKELVKYADQIDRVINENIPFGCCGGCA